MDIVVTVPKSEYENDDKETAVFEQGGYEQFWQLGKTETIKYWRTSIFCKAWSC